MGVTEPWGAHIWWTYLPPPVSQSSLLKRVTFQWIHGYMAPWILCLRKCLQLSRIGNMFSFSPLACVTMKHFLFYFLRNSRQKKCCLAQYTLALDAWVASIILRWVNILWQFALTWPSDPTYSFPLYLSSPFLCVVRLFPWVYQKCLNMLFSYLISLVALYHFLYPSRYHTGNCCDF